jgi:phospholipid-binding lipoprotein MlaA
MNRPESRIVKWLLLVAVIVMTGCAGAGQRPAGDVDPFERFNRAVFKFNKEADRTALEPTARAYSESLPSGVKGAITNFFRNLYEPTVLVNQVLQGKPKEALSDMWRFAFNSTVGVLGLFDVASKLGLERHDEDFGQTLAVWGVEEGPFLMLPFLGPSNVRDGVGLIPYYFVTDPRVAVKGPWTSAALIAVDVVDTRANFLGSEALVEAAALDPYLFIREAYRQRRLNQVYDGNPPMNYELLE